MNEEEAIERLKLHKDCAQIPNGCCIVNVKDVETVLNLLEKKDEKIEKYKMMLAENCARTLNSNLKQKHKHEEDLEALHLGWKEEIEKKDKIIDEIQKEVRDHIGFENRLKRDNKEPDLFNQGRFYVANNINNILKGKVENGN